MARRAFDGVSPLLLAVLLGAATPSWSQAATVDDRAEAEDYLRRGEAYQKGVGVPQADLFLGVLYQQGKGVRKDLEESATWYRRAAESGIEDAATELERLQPDLEAHRVARMRAEEINFGAFGTVPGGGSDSAGGEPVPRLVVHLGHTKPIVAVALSPDGELAATAGDDDVSSLAISDDGSTLVTGGWDRTARIWSLETAKELGVLSGHYGEVEYLGVHPATGSILTGGPDDPLRLWDPLSGSEIARPAGAPFEGNPVALSPSGRLVVTGTVCELRGFIPAVGSC